MEENTRNEVQVDLDRYNALLQRIDELEDAAAAAPQPAAPEPRFQKVKDLAVAIDAWRIFPRIFITTYIYLLYESSMWFMALSEPTMEQAGLISVIVGSGAAWFGLYANSGKSQ